MKHVLGLHSFKIISYLWALNTQTECIFTKLKNDASTKILKLYATLQQPLLLFGGQWSIGHKVLLDMHYLLINFREYVLRTGHLAGVLVHYWK